MSTRSIIALFLTLIMCLACFAGCTPNALVPDVTPESETLDPNHTEEPITEIPDEDLSGMNTSDDPLEDDKDYDKLEGKFELRNVTFGYAKLADQIIQDFSMSLE
ncbi:MAG: hypothetical protein IKY07_05865, partial [Clostridia bacterium]|nr:hypothetical protein [Clostridia bacterium]